MSYLLPLINVPSILVFVIATAAFFLIVRICTRKPNREDSRLSEIASEHGGEPAGEGLFGALTPALAAQLPESRKEQRDFRLLLRQAGLYHPTARITIYALRFVLLFVPLVATGVWAVMADSSHTWKPAA